MVQPPQPTRTRKAQENVTQDESTEKSNEGNHSDKSDSSKRRKLERTKQPPLKSPSINNFYIIAKSHQVTIQHPNFSLEYLNFCEEQYEVYSQIKNNEFIRLVILFKEFPGCSKYIVTLSRDSRSLQIY